MTGPDERAQDDDELDAEALARIERQGGRQLLGELLASFHVRTPRRLDQARSALEDGAPEDAARVFHSLKSSAGLVGAARVQAAARDAEEAARSGDLERAGALTESLAARFEALRPALERRRSAALPRLALVEDNEDNRMLVRVMLEPRFEVVEYADGISALEGLRAAPPEAVLLDISLPGMDGLEVLRELRSDERLRRIPAVALTAHAMAGDRERLLAAGFDAYVAKPILDDEDLIETVERCLRRRSGESGERA